MPYPSVNCLKTIPFTAAHIYIAHIWQYTPPPTPGLKPTINETIAMKNEYIVNLHLRLLP